MPVPNLLSSLQEHDLGHLRMIAEAWGVHLDTQELTQARDHLVEALTEPERIERVLAELPTEAHAALVELRQSGGQIAWANFSRKYGSVRGMGPARRDRERPDRRPESTSELLWYRGLIARIFMETMSGLEEFAYLPGEFSAHIALPVPDRSGPLGHQATPNQYQHSLPAGAWILDHACSLLAATRLGFTAVQLDTLEANWAEVFPQPYPLRSGVLLALLNSAALLATDGHPEVENARSFLEAERAQALLHLVNAWRASPDFNELRQLPGLVTEGAWQNDPRLARSQVVSWLKVLPEGKWWSLPAFIQAIKEQYPDFQRPAGNYEVWYLRSKDSEQFLSGFEHWDEVDGKLLEYLIAGPLHWLGITELGFPEGGRQVTSFRIADLGRALLAGEAPAGLPPENGRVLVRSDAHLSTPRLAPRALRYQLARFCEWEEERLEGYRYRLTPGSLARARRQDLQVSHLISLLRKAAGAIPPNIVAALKRWEQQGSEARLEQALILRLRSPEILQALRKSRAGRFLGDALGPTTVIVHAEAGEKVLAALAELGYLGEFETLT